ncbi:MAG: hypothetical protein KJ626_13485 [Verrucomicrobia bacterium]|nr:hypothetical protein [Verrucomicrobiota bacterium]
MKKRTQLIWLVLLIAAVMVLAAFSIVAMRLLADRSPPVVSDEIPPGSCIESIGQARELMAAQSNAIARARSEREELEKEIEVTRREAESLKAKLSEARNEEREAGRERAELEQEVNRLKGEIAAKRAILHVMTNQAERLEQMTP